MVRILNNAEPNLIFASKVMRDELNEPPESTFFFPADRNNMMRPAAQFKQATICRTAFGQHVQCCCVGPRVLVGSIHGTWCQLYHGIAADDIWNNSFKVKNSSSYIYLLLPTDHFKLKLKSPWLWASASLKCLRSRFNYELLSHSWLQNGKLSFCTNAISLQLDKTRVFYNSPNFKKPNPSLWGIA